MIFLINTVIAFHSSFIGQLKDIAFPLVCYVTLQPTLSVRRLVPFFFSTFLSFLGSGLLASNQPPSHALNLPPRPQICPPDLKSALQTFNQPSKLKTSLPNLKSALQALIMPSNPQICIQWHKSAI